MVVRVEAATAAVTCLAPCAAARGADSPRARNLYMFSITTTELSTNMPIARESAPRVIMFMSIPQKYMITSANSTENGIENATTSVGLTSRKNRASTTIASTAPSNKLCKIVLIYKVMYCPWSVRVIISRVGLSSFSFVSCALTASETSLVFAVEVLVTETITPSRPLSLAYPEPDSSTTLTLATSESFMSPTPSMFVITRFSSELRLPISSPTLSIYLLPLESST